MPYEEICRAMLAAGDALVVNDENSYKIAVSQGSEISGSKRSWS
jgi:hypothetical protein